MKKKQTKKKIEQNLCDVDGKGNATRAPYVKKSCRDRNFLRERLSSKPSLGVGGLFRTRMSSHGFAALSSTTAVHRKRSPVWSVAAIVRSGTCSARGGKANTFRANCTIDARERRITARQLTTDYRIKGYFVVPYLIRRSRIPRTGSATTATGVA